MIQQRLGVLELELEPNIRMPSGDIAYNTLYPSHIGRDANSAESGTCRRDDIIAHAAFNLADIQSGRTKQRRFRKLGRQEIIQCPNKRRIRVYSMVRIPRMTDPKSATASQQTHHEFKLTMPSPPQLAQTPDVPYVPQPIFPRSARRK